jgi:hypothetical protein
VQKHRSSDNSVATRASSALILALNIIVQEEETEILTVMFSLTRVGYIQHDQVWKCNTAKE